jgi:hypothetical protein
VLLFTSSTIWHSFILKPFLCWHLITKILRNGPRAHFPFITPGARSGPKHRQLAHQVGGVSLIQASSMAIIFQHKIALHPGSMFCFGTVSSMAYEDGILHRIADPPEKKPSSKISEKARTRQQIAQPLVPRAKATSSKLGAENSFTQRTLLSTSSMEEWTQITRKKEASGI